MSYRCNQCLYIFAAKKSCCPYCGGRLYKNEADHISLTGEGFRPAPEEQTVPEGQNAFDNSVSNRPDDVLTALRESYRREYETPGGPARKRMPLSDSGTEAFRESSPDRNGKAPHSADGGTDAPDFFSEIRSTHTPRVPVVEKPGVSPAPEASLNRGRDRERRQTDAQHRRLAWERRLRRAFNLLRSIPRRSILRGIQILAAVVLLVTLWHMRYAILDAVTDFLLSLLPPALAIGFFLYLAKRLFKR